MSQEQQEDTKPTEEETPLVGLNNFKQAQAQVVRYDARDIEGFGRLRIRSLTDKQYTRITTAAVRKDGTVDRNVGATFGARLIAACAVDEQGNTFMKDEDAKYIRNMDAALVDKMVAFCREHVGVRDEEEVKND